MGRPLRGLASLSGWKPRRDRPPRSGQCDSPSERAL